MANDTNQITRFHYQIGGTNYPQSDVNVAVAPDADPEAQMFLDFLITDEAQSLMKTEGWVR